MKIMASDCLLMMTGARDAHRMSSSSAIFHPMDSDERFSGKSRNLNATCVNTKNASVFVECRRMSRCG